MANPWDEAPIVQPWETAPIVQPVPPERTWTDTAKSAVWNTPGSALNMAKGIGEAIINPSATAGHIMDLAAGELRTLTPEPIRNLLDKIDPNPRSAAVAQQTADAINEVYSKGYGSVGGFKERLATDPVGVLGDISTVLTGGGSAAGRLGALAGSSKAAGLGEALSKAGNVTNPLSVVPAAIGEIASGTGNLAASALGSKLATGVGGNTIREAFQAGKAGDSSFMSGLSGKTTLEDVLSTQKQNLDNIQEAKQAAYRSGMVDVRNDKTILDFKGIDDAIKTAENKASYNGSTVNFRASSALQQAKAAVDEWKQGDPSIFATPEGLDALKKRIGSIQESIPFEERTARSAVGDIYNSIKKEISAQSPTYAKTMGDYAETSRLVDEASKSLSMGRTAQVDTALNKLKSLTKSDSHRADLAAALGEQGGTNIAPSLAGIAMKDAMPVGGLSDVGNMGIVGSAVGVNPAIAALLAARSPKLVGAGAYGAGRVAGIPGQAASKLPPDALEFIMNNGDRAKAFALLLQQSQQGNK